MLGRLTRYCARRALVTSTKIALSFFRLSFASKLTWRQSRGGILDLETGVEESIRVLEVSNNSEGCAVDGYMFTEDRCSLNVRSSPILSWINKTNEGNLE